MTQEDIDMLKRAIDTHTARLYEFATAHRDNGNREAQTAYLMEMKRYEQLKAKL